MPLKKTVRQLVDAAEAVIDTLSAERAITLAGREDTVVVDLRDIRERVREGFIGGSLHVPRGMLEFWIDPESPYFKDVFASGKHFVLYCASGWRSALAAKAVTEMGLEPVSHIGGGFTAWCEAGGEVVRSDDGREPRK